MEEDRECGKKEGKTQEFPEDVNFRVANAKYGIEVPHDESLDEVMADWSASWMDLSYGPDGDGFTQGQGCEWKDEREIEFEVHIDRRSWEAIRTDVKAILQRMFKEVRDDMNRRICAEPCHSDGLTWEKVSHGLYAKRYSKMRPYPGGSVPHDWRQYDHYWHVLYQITYKYTRKCTR